MRKAIAHTAAYDTAITRDARDDHARRRAVRAPAPPRTVAGSRDRRSTVSLEKIRDLRYGENPHQRAAWYAAADRRRRRPAARRRDDPPGQGAVVHEPARSRRGRAHRARVRRAGGRGHQAHESVRRRDRRRRRRRLRARARRRQPRRLRRHRRAESAASTSRRPRRSSSTFIEAVIAPGVDAEARAILARKPNMRVVIADFDASAEPAASSSRSILGATLVQERDFVAEARRAVDRRRCRDGPARRHQARSRPPEEWEALRFAWRICAHVKSNTVIFTDATRTLAIGAGQMSRVDAVNVALMKARRASRSSASARRIGRRVGRVLSVPRRPRRGRRRRRDRRRAAGRIGARREVIAAADEHGLAMVFTGRRHFRH